MININIYSSISISSPFSSPVFLSILLFFLYLNHTHLSVRMVYTLSYACAVTICPVVGKT